jgi:hypothetical protein
MTLMVTPTKSPDTLEHRVLARLFADLSGGAIAYAVLRNHEHLPFSVGARDIDIVVRPEHLRKAIDIVVKLAKDFDLRFANHYADERMTQITLMRRLSEGMFDLKIDFFTSSQAFGTELLSAGDMLADLRFHNGIPVVSEMVLLLDKFLFHLVVGEPVHPKYDARFARIVRGHQQGLERYLVSLLGRREAERLIRAMATDAASALEPLAPFKRLGLWLALSRRRRTGRLVLMARFLWQRIRNRVRPIPSFPPYGIAAHRGDGQGRGRPGQGRRRLCAAPSCGSFRLRRLACAAWLLRHGLPRRLHPAGAPGIEGPQDRSFRPVLSRHDLRSRSQPNQVA